MSALPEGAVGTLVLVGIILLVHESWRWAGLVLARDLTTESALFRWVQLVATALVAGLVARLVVFPAGALEAVDLTLRLAGVAVGIAIFLVTGRNLLLGVFVGSAVVLVPAFL
ncbi:MAG: AzlD domain-containing protein [Pseudomonadota bacterium]